jgi:FkbM family methyltransferase
MLNTRFIADVGWPRYVWRTACRQFTKRVLRIGNRIRLPTGHVLDLPRLSPTAGEVYVTNADIDWGSEALLVSHLDSAGCFLDIGANIGYYALYVAPAVKTVFAFEPDPRNWPDLEANATHADNVTVVHMAVWREPGRLALDVSSNSAVSFLRPDGMDRSTIETDVTTVDIFAAGLAGSFISGIKIDVEGMDLDVLRGAHQVMLDQRPLILTEFSFDQERSNDPDELFDIVGKVDYAIFAYVRGGPDSSKRRFGLRAIDRATFGAHRLKMLFLVPPQLQIAFAAEARK